MMMQSDRLDRFFPITYPNGATVSRFAKPCPHCQQLVKASAMEGVAILLQDKVFVLADAECPQCQHRFVVKCVIDAYKRVFPVQLPVFLYRWMLHWGARRQLKLFRQQPEWQRARRLVEAMDSAEVKEAVSQLTSRLLADSAAVEKSADIVGRFQNLPIYAWLRHDGRTLLFDRAAPDSDAQFQLQAGEVLFDGRLIYKEVTPEQA